MDSASVAEPKSAAFRSSADAYSSANASFLSNNSISCSKQHRVKVEHGLNEDPGDNLDALDTFLMALLVCSSVAAIVGNLLSIAIFSKFTSSKRTVQNYYLISLSVADLLVGAISIPGWIHLMLTKYRPYWPAWLCKLYLSIDISTCNLAVLSVVLISYDRYTLCSGSLNQNNKRKAVRNILIVTVIALCLHTPFIVFWNMVAGSTTVTTDTCDYEYNGNVPFTVATAFVYYFVPLLLLINFNIRAYYSIRTRYQRRVMKLMHQHDLPSDRYLDEYSLPPTNEAAGTRSRSSQSMMRDVPMSCDETLQQSVDAVLEQFKSATVRFAVEKKRKSTDKEPDARQSPTQAVAVKRLLRREARIGRILLCVVLVFCICWTPYMTYTAICSVSTSWCYPLAFKLTGSLLYSNSAINPFLYGLLHPSVRIFLRRMFRLRHAPNVRSQFERKL